MSIDRIMPRSELPAALRALGAEMRRVAIAMDHYGKSGRLGRLGRQLLSQSRMPSDWADREDADQLMAAATTREGQDR